MYRSNYLYIENINVSYIILYNIAASGKRKEKTKRQNSKAELKVDNPDIY